MGLAWLLVWQCFPSERAIEVEMVVSTYQSARWGPAPRHARKLRQLMRNVR